MPFAAGFAAIAVAMSAQISVRGCALAAASGSVATGLGYCTWYAVLPALGASRAAIAQLSVPVITAGAAIVLLGEPLGRDVVIGGGGILGGLALALWQRRVSSRRHLALLRSRRGRTDGHLRGTGDPRRSPGACPR